MLDSKVVSRTQFKRCSVKIAERNYLVLTVNDNLYGGYKKKISQIDLFRL